MKSFLVANGVLSLAAMVSATSAFAFVPSTLFSLDVKPSVVYDGQRNEFVYSYALSNSSTSQQSVLFFGVLYEGSRIGSVQNPGDWHSVNSYQGKDIVLWYGRNRRLNTVIPGKSMTGFTVRSANLPGIRFAYSQSSYTHAFEDGVEFAEAVEARKLEFYNNSCRVETIGPGPVVTKSPLVTTQYLIDSKHAAYDRGWISKSGIVKSLDVKLDAAKASYGRGNRNAALNQLNAFKSELNAQRGKAVNEAAFALLYSTAEYLSSL